MEALGAVRDLETPVSGITIAAVSDANATGPAHILKTLESALIKAQKKGCNQLVMIAA